MAQKLAELERLECDREASRFHLLEVEEVIDRPREALRFPVNGVQVAAAGLFVEVAVEQELDEAEHAGKRRSQLV